MGKDKDENVLQAVRWPSTPCDEDVEFTSSAESPLLEDPASTLPVVLGAAEGFWVTAVVTLGGFAELKYLPFPAFEKTEYARCVTATGGERTSRVNIAVCVSNSRMKT